jgi:LuxR family transcriptional regulator, maltose regulon positive regulatory protein
MNATIPYQEQFLTTKFFVPEFSHALIQRSRLADLLGTGIQRKLTLVSAPAGFGKTTLLASWVHMLPPGHPHVAWVSLDQRDNDPIIFWSYIIAALDRQQPGLFASLLASLQAQPTPPLQYVLATLINTLVKHDKQFLLILDDYHLITKSEVHSSLTKLVEHLPSQLHLILATRTDPPMPLPLLRVRDMMQEIRTDQLRCTVEEARDFLKNVFSIKLPDKAIQKGTRIPTIC